MSQEISEAITLDVTNDFLTRLKENGRTARNWGYGAFVAGPSGYGAKYYWFYQKVRNGGDWDLKNNAYLGYKASGLYVCGRHYQNDMPGNFHYGFVGKAAGFLATALFVGAGQAQKRAGTSKPEYDCTYGDDPVDHEFIRLGIQLYKNVGVSVTYTSLDQVLKGFTTIVCEP